MTPVIGLDTYTDTTTMRSLLQAMLPGFDDGRLHIDALGVRSVRRNTSRERNPCPMTLCYELQVRDTTQGRSGAQWLYGQVYRSAQATAAAFAQHRGSPLTAPAFGEPLVQLPLLNLLLWALPNDPGLPQLPALLDPAQAAHLLPAGVAGTVQVELTRYEPQRRATLRYTVDPGGDSEPQTLYAKTFCDERSEDVHTRFNHFWQLSQHNPHAPLVAKPLGHDGATRTVWQAQAPGVPLRPLLTTPDAPLLMGRFARALALLHAAPLAPSAGTAPRSVAHWRAEVRRRQNKIARIDEAWAARAGAVADAIEAHAAHPATRPLSVIHGDCHPDQVWIHRGRVVLFDFDEFTLGDPMEDLAEFVVKLEQAGAPARLASRLFEHYAAAAPDRFDARTLAWHLAIQSLLQVTRSFIYQRPGWADELPRRLAAAEARARECS
jgi:aminoglycoside phosphotransferase